MSDQTPPCEPRPAWPGESQPLVRPSPRRERGSETRATRPRGVLVVTAGIHSLALRARLSCQAGRRITSPKRQRVHRPRPPAKRGKPYEPEASASASPEASGQAREAIRVRSVSECVARGLRPSAGSHTSPTSELVSRGWKATRSLARAHRMHVCATLLHNGVVYQALRILDNASSQAAENPFHPASSVAILARSFRA